MKIIAPAKINLALNVLERKPDGYHNVDMVMQPLTLADEIFLETAEVTSITCNQPQVPLDQRNLAWKAVQLLKTECGITNGVKIVIQKNIPVAAGLAGGSTDAAAVLIGLNHMWRLGLTVEQLMQIGVRLGADVPFCIIQKTARAEGIGERLTALNTKLQCEVLLITPNIEVSTPFVYGQLNVDQIKKRPRILEVIDALEKGDLTLLEKAWGNVLEEVVLPHFSQVQQIKSVLGYYGIKDCLMSGSGPSVFALNPPMEKVELIRQKLPKEWFSCVCRFQNNTTIF